MTVALTLNRRDARKMQTGISFVFVKNVEVAICPFCKAYERVHGKKAQEKREETCP